MIKIATVCSGIGSPEQALRNIGVSHQIPFACEIDKYARQTYLANFNPDQMYTDMTKEEWDKPDQYSDLFIGGIPCQAFSLAGKRLGEMDKRGLLFYDFYRYVKNQQPKVFIIENVKGLLSSISDLTLPTILLSLLFKIEQTESWEQSSTRQNKLTTLSQTISNYLLLNLHQKSALRKQEQDTLLTKNSTLSYEQWEQRVKHGLKQRLQFLEGKICQITKKSNYYQDEATQQSECKEEDSILNQKTLYSIESLKAKVTSLLENTMDIQGNTDLFVRSDLGDNSKKERLYITLTELNSTMNQTTCMYVLEMNIIRLIILASELSRNLCKEVWLISTGKKEFIGLKTFDIWLGYLNSLMYNLHFEVLNSKDFGVPQNRERVFLIGVRNDLPNTFRFPPGFILTKRLKDILEPEVGEKYYLSDKMLSCLNTHSEKNKNNIGRTASFLSGKDLASTVKANYGKMPGDADYVKVDKVGFINQDTQGSAVYSTESVSPTVCAGTHGYAMGYIKESNEIMIACNLPGKHEATGRVYDTNGISPCVTAKQGGGHEPKILEPKAGQITGRNPENPKSRKSGLPTEQMLEINQNDDITNTITTVQKDNVIVVGQTTNSRIAGWHENENTIGAHMGDAKRSSVSEHVYHKPEGICNTIQTAHTPKLFGSRIRRLTPLECMRLQGFPDEYIKPCSDSQTYKQAGNSITVNVMEAIIKNLLPIIQ